MSNIDLLSLFNNVSGVLQKNKTSLNKADDHNGDHGDNMVQTFEMITQAMKEKSGADPADQLAYASQLLRKSKSGSAKLYAEGLGKASNEFEGQKITQQNAMQLIQTLMGGGEPAASPDNDNPLNSLLGGLLGGAQSGPASQSDSGLDVGDLLGGLLGGSQASNDSQDSPGLDAGDLLNAGLAFMSAKQSGDSTVEALVDAVVSATPFAQSAHR
ncbi:MAG: DAK2 domain-containing protein, partial [Chloroflexi bacterium]|nr:DAK2 domain-containing protein [Chloroflexota bacterium]